MVAQRRLHGIEDLLVGILHIGAYDLDLCLHFLGPHPVGQKQHEKDPPLKHAARAFPPDRG